MAALMEALARGGKVEWDGEGRPRLFVPQGMAPKLASERPFIREVLRRAAIFRAQLAAPGPIPFVHLPEARGREVREGECLSCAGPLPEGSRWRCPLCLAAAQIALRPGEDP